MKNMNSSNYIQINRASPSLQNAEATNRMQQQQRISLYNIEQAAKRTDHVILNRKNSLDSKNEFEHKRNYEFLAPKSPAFARTEAKQFLNRNQLFPERKSFRNSDTDSDEKSIMLSDYENIERSSGFKSSQLFDKNQELMDRDSSESFVFNRNRRLIKLHNNNNINRKAYDNHLNIYKRYRAVSGDLISASYSRINANRSANNKFSLKRNTVEMPSPNSQCNTSTLNLINAQKYSKYPHRKFDYSSSDDSAQIRVGKKPLSFTNHDYLASPRTYIRKKNLSLYYDSGIGADNNTATNSFYSKDFRLNNIRLGEVENNGPAAGDTMANKENKTMKQTVSSSSMGAKLSYKTMNPSMMRKYYDMSMQELNASLNAKAKNYDNLFLSNNKKVNEKSYSEAEANQAASNLTKNHFGSMLSIPIQVRGEEGLKVAEEPVKASFNKADFTPHLINTKASNLSDSSKFHSACLTTSMHVDLSRDNPNNNINIINNISKNFKSSQAANTSNNSRLIDASKHSINSIANKLKHLITADMNGEDKKHANNMNLNMQKNLDEYNSKSRPHSLKFQLDFINKVFLLLLKLRLALHRRHSARITMPQMLHKLVGLLEGLWRLLYFFSLILILIISAR